MWNRFAIACLAVLIASSALVWYQYHHSEVPGEIARDVRRTVQRYPNVEPLLEEAMSDGTLSMSDVDRILDAVEEGEQ